MVSFKYFEHMWSFADGNCLINACDTFLSVCQIWHICIILCKLKDEFIKNIEKYMPSFYFDVENISFPNIVHKYVSWVGLGCSAVVTGSFFSPKYHRHPIAHPGGRGMGYLLWVQCLTYVSPWSVYCYNVRSIWYHGIFVRVIMAPDWISGLMSSITGMSRLLLIVINIIADKTFNMSHSEISGDVTDNWHDNSVYHSHHDGGVTTEIQCMPLTDKLDSVSNKSISCNDDALDTIFNVDILGIKYPRSLVTAHFHVNLVPYKVYQIYDISNCDRMDIF